MNSGKELARRFLRLRQGVESLAQQALVDALENQAKSNQDVFLRERARLDLLAKRVQLSSGDQWQQWYAALQVAELFVQTARLNAQAQLSQVALRRQEMLAAHQDKRRWEVTVQRLEEQAWREQTQKEQQNADEMAGIRHGPINPP